MHITNNLLFIVLIFFVFLSAFFSGSETGMMSLNRYRLRHLVRSKNRAAMRVSALLGRIDKLLGCLPQDCLKSESEVEPEAWVDQVLQQQRCLRTVQNRLYSIVERI